MIHHVKRDKYPVYMDRDLNLDRNLYRDPEDVLVYTLYIVQ